MRHILIDLLLDTNIYRKDPNHTSLPFGAIERLCKAKALRLHIPYIVQKEVQTQQLSAYKKEIDSAISSVKALLKKNLPDELHEKIDSIKHDLASVHKDVLSSAEQEILDWAEILGATVHSLDLDLAVAAMDAYFYGKPPLKEPKVRKDIPDSFLFQSVLSILGNVQNLYVVSDDDAFYAAVAELDNVKVFKTLNEVVELQETQAALQEAHAAEIANIVSGLKTEDCRAIVSRAVSQQIGEKLMWQTVRSASIPDDNNEATIAGYNDAEDVFIDPDSITFYGDGKFGAQFECTVLVSVIFYIFKSDYYLLDEAEMPSVSDHNDHYYEAEAEYYINVSGSVSVTVDMETVDAQGNISNYIVEDKIRVEDEIKFFMTV